jgi:hypothetical protein
MRTRELKNLQSCIWNYFARIVYVCLKFTPIVAVGVKWECKKFCVNDPLVSKTELKKVTHQSPTCFTFFQPYRNVKQLLIVRVLAHRVKSIETFQLFKQGAGFSSQPDFSMLSNQQVFRE